MFTGGTPQTILAIGAGTMLLVNIGLGSSCCPQFSQLAFWSSPVETPQYMTLQEYTDLLDSPTNTIGAPAADLETGPSFDFRGMSADLPAGGDYGSQSSHSTWRSAGNRSPVYSTDPLLDAAGTNPAGSPTITEVSEFDGWGATGNKFFVVDDLDLPARSDQGSVETVSRRLLERLCRLEAAGSTRPHQAA